MAKAAKVHSAFPVQRRLRKAIDEAAAHYGVNCYYDLPAVHSE